MFISEAYAQAASGAAAQPGGLESMFSSFGVMILIFAVFWFLLIRPQQKRQKEHKKMIDALTTGNEVITAGGICGKIVAADENYINLQIAAVADKPVVSTLCAGVGRDNDSYESIPSLEIYIDCGDFDRRSGIYTPQFLR